MRNPYDFVKMKDEITTITFHDKCSFLSSLPEFNYIEKKKLLEDYTKDDIDNFFNYYYRLYKSRIEDKECIWL